MVDGISRGAGCRCPVQAHRSIAGNGGLQHRCTGCGNLRRGADFGGGRAVAASVHGLDDEVIRRPVCEPCCRVAIGSRAQGRQRGSVGPRNRAGEDLVPGRAADRGPLQRDRRISGGRHSHDRRCRVLHRHREHWMAARIHDQLKYMLSCRQSRQVVFVKSQGAAGESIGGIVQNCRPQLQAVQQVAVQAKHGCNILVMAC
ncbi:hypothetical protein D3C73_763030 [compost metagenome]